MLKYNIKCNNVFSKKIKPLRVPANDGLSSEGDQHFKGNASHVLHACCHVWVTLVLKIVKTELLKLIKCFN
jgi:hypothetical protein